MAELVFELLGEEIPARMQQQAAGALQELFLQAAQDNALRAEGVQTFVTPRRLVLIAHDLSEMTQARHEEKRGPRLGAPPQALEGFLKSLGIELSDCQQRDGYWYAIKAVAAKPTVELLPQMLAFILQNLAWPKSMRWPEAQQVWVRPVRQSLCLYNGKALTIPLPSLGLVTAGITQGHRFLAPAALTVNSITEYQQALAKAYVIIDPRGREDLIRAQLDTLAHSHKLQLVKDEGLLTEVIGLVEYPHVLLGSIDPAFMHLPQVVLLTSMRNHQRYFAFTEDDGALAPFFAAVANSKAPDQGQEMLRGFERVLRTRLSDATFFWEQDLKRPLESLVPKLKQIIFHGQLGTLGQKVLRLQQLVESEAGKRAALLCKSDLLTHMVKEFPELQGQMGALYALQQGEAPAVAHAIREHYQPQGPHDSCPQNPVSIELALADKIDTLSGFFAIGEVPSGSRDPYALRRAALGVIRLLKENELKDYDLHPLLEKALDLYQQQGIKADKVIDKLYEFILERLVVALKGEGLRHDCVRAVIAAYKPQGKILGSLMARASALHAFLPQQKGQELFRAARRTLRIIANGPKIPDHINPELFQQAEEQELFLGIESLRVEIDGWFAGHDYEKILEALSSISPLVESFFERVTVNTDDVSVRLNRLGLLEQLAHLFSRFADFSCLEG